MRALRVQEGAELERLTRSQREPAVHVAGRRPGDGVAKLVSRFNVPGLAAVAGRPLPGRVPTYDDAARGRILIEARRAPPPAQDGTAPWSLSTLRRALRRAPDGLPRVSTHTIRTVLTQAGVRFGRPRSWCPTGAARRKRKSGVVEVRDPDAAASSWSGGRGRRTS